MKWAVEVMLNQFVKEIDFLKLFFVTAIYCSRV